MSDDAVTSTFAFIIAVGIMMGSVTAVYVATEDIASPGIVQESEQVNLQSEAAALKQIIMDSPGVITGGAAWDEATSPSADDLVRLGLLEPDGSGVQVEKLRNLRLAPFEADATDGYANYEEVIAGIGLDDKGLDFHIRAEPTMKSVDDILNDPGLRDKQLKVTYIANVSSKSSDGGAVDEGLVVDAFACDESPANAGSYRFSINITNGGATTTQFFAVFDIGSGPTVTRQDQTDLVAAGDTATLHVDVENTDDVTCDSDTTAEIDILDPVQLLRTEDMSAPDVGASTPGDSADEFYVEAGVPYANSSEVIELSYYGDEEKDDPLTLEVRVGTDPAGTIEYSANETVPKDKKERHIDIPANTLSDGEYTAYLTNNDLGITSTQRLLVVAGTPDAYGSGGSTTYDEGESVAIEARFLSDLAENFCPTYYDNKTNSPTGDDWSDRCSHFKDESALWDGQVQPGDIFPDLQKELWDMEPRLLSSNGTPRYDIVNTLVVGSNVAHNSMTSNNFGDPLEAWVLGGGTLIVFGSPGQSTQWLQNLFHAGQTSSSGGISAPDTSHPLLSTPEPLAYDQYETSGKGWKYTGGADEHFTDVVEQGGTPTTAVSDPGDFGDGTIVLTSWLPYDLFGTGSGSSTDEGIRLMYNFLMQSYRDLFLDYGPQIPDGVPAIPAVGRSFVDHEDLGQLTLDFTLYVFPPS